MNVFVDPKNPFEAYREKILTSGKWMSEDDQRALLLIGYNTFAKQSLLKRIRHDLFKMAMITEQCPECGHKMDVNASVWRMSGAGLLCNICAGEPPGTLITSDTHEKVGFQGDRVVLPERIRNDVKESRARRHQNLQLHIATLDELIEVDPENPWLFVHRGRLRSHLCEFEGRSYVVSRVWLEDFNKAVELNPTDPWILCWRALEFYGRRTNKDQVIHDLEKACALDPSFQEAREFLEQNINALNGSWFDECWNQI